MNTRKIGEYEIVDHGIEHAQYFQGCGVAYTPYTNVVTGAGNDFVGALDDALDQASCEGWDVGNVCITRVPTYPNVLDIIENDLRANGIEEDSPEWDEAFAERHHIDIM